MVKIINLLAKIGLVYDKEAPTSSTEGDETSSAAPQTGEPSPAVAYPTVVRSLPEVKLDTAALDKDPKGDEFEVEKVYASAGIKPPAHGFTVYRLMEMLEGEEFRGLDETTRARVITGVLKRLPTGPVEVDDIVRDAAMRDRALDAFEKFMADRVAKSEQEAAVKNQALQKEIDDLTQKNSELIATNLAKVEEEKVRLERWKTHKRAEEDRLFTAVAPFVDRNPITREDAPEAPVSPVKK